MAKNPDQAEVNVHRGDHTESFALLKHGCQLGGVFEPPIRIDQSMNQHFIRDNVRLLDEGKDGLHLDKQKRITWGRRYWGKIFS